MRISAMDQAAADTVTAFFVNEEAAAIDAWNANPKLFIWTRNADQILETMAAYRGRIND